METFPTTEMTFTIPASHGVLEILTSPAQENIPEKNITAIICHPHPLYGGTMYNKVVTTLARTFRDLGMRTVRFNFRGIGKSTGIFDEGRGEADDLVTVIDWVKKIRPEDKIFLAGFSFGGFIAAKVAVTQPPAQLVTVAPQVSRFIETKLPPIICPWILVHGEQDEIIPFSEVLLWYETLDPKPVFIRIPDAGHFFHGKLVELRSKLEEFLS